MCGQKVLSEQVPRELEDGRLISKQVNLTFLENKIKKFIFPSNGTPSSPPLPSFVFPFESALLNLKIPSPLIQETEETIDGPHSINVNPCNCHSDRIC